MAQLQSAWRVGFSSGFQAAHGNQNETAHRGRAGKNKNLPFKPAGILHFLRPVPNEMNISLF